MSHFPHCSYDKMCFSWGINHTWQPIHYCNIRGLGVFIQGCLQVACRLWGFSVSNPEHFHVMRRPKRPVPPCPHIMKIVPTPLPMFIMCPPRLPGGQEGEDPGARDVRQRGWSHRGGAAAVREDRVRPGRVLHGCGRPQAAVLHQGKQGFGNYSESGRELESELWCHRLWWSSTCVSHDLKGQFRYFEHWAPFLVCLGRNRVVNTEILNIGPVSSIWPISNRSCFTMAGYGHPQTCP